MITYLRHRIQFCCLYYDHSKRRYYAVLTDRRGCGDGKGKKRCQNARIIQYFGYCDYDHGVTPWNVAEEWINRVRPIGEKAREEYIQRELIKCREVSHA